MRKNNDNKGNMVDKKVLTRTNYDIRLRNRESEDFWLIIMGIEF